MTESVLIYHLAFIAIVSGLLGAATAALCALGAKGSFVEILINAVLAGISTSALALVLAWSMYLLLG